MPACGKWGSVGAPLRTAAPGDNAVIIMMRIEDWIGKVGTMDGPILDSWSTHVLAVMDTRVGVQVEVHRISAAPARPATRGRTSQLFVAVEGSIRTDCPHQANTLQSRR